MKSVDDLTDKLQETRQRVRNLTVIGLRPDLPPHKREVVRQLERSARAEVKLRRKALEHAQKQK
jgi:hypothetical protein